MKHIQRLFVAVPLLMGLCASPSWGQQLISSASRQDLVTALGGDANGGLPSKAFRRTAAPDADSHACPEVMADANTGTGGLGSRNLTVVYAADNPSAPPPAAQLAIQFATGSDRILPASDGLLSSLAAALMDPSMANVRVAVAGHTDATGNRNTNLQLSCARAIAVRNRLIQMGVAADRMGAYGFGPDKPLQPGVVQSAVNRRVEIRRAN